MIRQHKSFYHKIPSEELYYLEPLGYTVVNGNMYLGVSGTVHGLE